MVPIGQKLAIRHGLQREALIEQIMDALFVNHELFRTHVYSVGQAVAQALDQCFKFLVNQRDVSADGVGSPNRGAPDRLVSREVASECRALPFDPLWQKWIAVG